LQLRTPTACGSLDLNGKQSIRADPHLLGLLRALPGVSEVALQLQKPWIGEAR
jgi:DNA polymerase-3 subunit alpha